MKQKFLKICLPILSGLLVVIVVLCSSFSCFASMEGKTIIATWAGYTSLTAFPRNQAYPIYYPSVDEDYSTVRNYLQSNSYEEIGSFCINQAYFSYNIQPEDGYFYTPIDPILGEMVMVIDGLNADGLINAGDGLGIYGMFLCNYSIPQYEDRPDIDANKHQVVGLDLSNSYSYTSDGKIIISLPIEPYIRYTNFCLSIKAYNRSVTYTDIMNMNVYLGWSNEYEPDPLPEVTPIPSIITDMWTAEIDTITEVGDTIINAYFSTDDRQFSMVGIALFSVVGLGIISAIVALILKICRGDK